MKLLEKQSSFQKINIKNANFLISDSHCMVNAKWHTYENKWHTYEKKWLTYKKKWLTYENKWHTYER